MTLKVQFLLVLVFIASKSVQAQIINSKDVETKNSLFYHKGNLFSGRLVEYNKDGQVLSISTVIDGILNGKCETFYESKGFVKSRYKDTAVTNQTKREIVSNQNELIKLSVDSSILVGKINDLVNYKLGGEKKLIKIKAKNEQGKLNEKDKQAFDEFVSNELEMKKLLMKKSLIVSELNNQQVLMSKETAKVEFNPIVFEVFDVKNGLKNGTYIKYSEDGKKIEEGAYLLGKQDGVWKYYFSNGNLKATGVFRLGDGSDISTSSKIPKNGREEKWLFYHENGKLKEEGNYSNGKPNGISKLYHENGQLKQESNYSKGNLNGIVKFYHENGKLKEEGNYSNGKRNGISKLYHENGQLKQESNYSNGNLNGIVKVYHENGNLHYTTQNVNGKEEGIRKTYFASGKTEAQLTYKNNEPQGPFLFFYETGKIQVKGNLDTLSLHEAKFIGDLYTYKSDGTLESHTYVSKDGNEENRLIVSKSSTLTDANKKHSCSWCGKTFTGFGWMINPHPGYVDKSCSASEMFLDLGFGYLCSQKCSIEKCRSE
jgi:antitoxin component YwqK of YwqJK toxin-antitoxin module